MKYSQSNANIVAANRFGYGVLKNSNLKSQLSAKLWLKSGLIEPKFSDDLPSSIDIRQQLAAYRALKKSKNKTLTKSQKNYHRKTYDTFIQDSLQQLVYSEHSIQWRLLDFFSNHFSVTAQNIPLTALSPTLEREAIAPNLFGLFEDMLVSVVQHPAMLLYLNNERSFGPNSKWGKRGKGLNENLAREILELHTLGVQGGYEQQDVLELAKGITGWSIANVAKAPDQGFVFYSKGHEPGKRVLLGKVYQAQGLEQGITMLKAVARHPSTRQHICRKLATHFISDQPSAELIQKLENTWSKTNGNIKAVMTTLIDAEESWSPSTEKFKSPRDFVLSTLRLLKPKKVNSRQFYQMLKQLGQAPFKAGSPAGYPDTEADWLGANALMTRIDLATTIAGRYKPNAEHLLSQSFADTVTEHTYLSVVRAESRHQAASLFLLSPEFQRR